MQTYRKTHTDTEDNVLAQETTSQSKLSMTFILILIGAGIIAATGFWMLCYGKASENEVTRDPDTKEKEDLIQN